MSLRYKQKRRERYYRNSWRCPLCRYVNAREHEGLDECDACQLSTHTRYADARLVVTECDSEIVRCWCGAEGPVDSLFDDTGLDDRCGGSGVLYCHCGGDLCVCHYHGEVECLGCEDCEEPADDFDDEPEFRDEDRIAD